MKKRVTKKVRRLAFFLVIKYIASLLYFTGLTVLIPLIPLVLSPGSWENAQTALVTAGGFIVAGFTLVYWFEGSKRKALQTLGMMTIVPGLLSVIFLFTGPRRMTNFYQLFGEISPYLESFLEGFVPKAWFLAGLYIVIGVLLYWLAEKARR